MKVKIGNYELNVTVKSSYDNRATKESLFNFLNELSIVYEDASKWYFETGYNAIGVDFKKKGETLYKMLKENGVYDRI